MAREHVHRRVLEAALSVDVADDATFTFAVRNAGSDSVDLRFSSAQEADVAVFDRGTGDDPGTGAVWRWSDDRAFAQVLRSTALAPGESFVAELAWPDPEPGDYEAVATLEADVEGDYEAVATLEADVEGDDGESATARTAFVVD